MESMFRYCSILSMIILTGCPEIGEHVDNENGNNHNSIDRDGDGYASFSDGGVDCNDSDSQIHPGAHETWYDGVDQNCDSLSDYDQDGDGFDTVNDCDDTNGDVHPEALEVWYDGVDQNCDGLHDDDQDGDGLDISEDCDDMASDIGLPSLVAYHDFDGDGYGDDPVSEQYCDEHELRDHGHVINNQDCDDSDPRVYEGCCIQTECDYGLAIQQNVGPDFVFIEGGSFHMGSPEGEFLRGDDETQYPVTLTKDFYMMTTEISQGMFEAAMGYSPWDDYGGTNFGQDHNIPVYNVSWHEMAAFANAISQQDGLDGCYECSGEEAGVLCSEQTSYDSIYDCDGYRMPTEAEWEYAARADSTHSFWTRNGGGSIAAWADNYNCEDSIVLSDGSALGDMAWYCGNTVEDNNDPSFGNQPIATKQSNGWGLYDMQGNVWEWCHDGYDLYPESEEINPEGIINTDRKVIRGGQSGNSPRHLRVANRESEISFFRQGQLSGRLVRSIFQH
jgi:formylglycine-generating enzyme required for sulfatase activity